jgi:hypothetical protein
VRHLTFAHYYHDAHSERRLMIKNSIPSTKLPVASQRSYAWSEAIGQGQGGLALPLPRGRADREIIPRRLMSSYAIGENDAGMSILVCWLTGLSPL